MVVQSEKDNRSRDSGRRSFLNWLWVGLGLVALVEVVWLAFSFLRPRKKDPRLGDFGSVISVGTVDGFKPNTVTAFPRGQFYLACLEDGGFLAVSRRCTHLGCTLPWDDEKKRFDCPCHSSSFDIRGNVIRAPAPRALDTFPIHIENNRVKVNTGKRIKRSAYRKDQAVYPSQQ